MFGRKGLTPGVPAAPPQTAAVLDLASHRVTDGDDATAPRPANDLAPDVAAPARDTVGPAAAKVRAAASAVQAAILQRIDSEIASRMDRDSLTAELAAPVGEILAELKIQLNQREQRQLVDLLLDDMLGLGPLEPLLADETDHRHHGQRPAPGLRRAARQARADRRRASATTPTC